MDEGGDGGGDDGNILPIMQSIMQNLLSKEVLYPSLKEITAKVCICFTVTDSVVPLPSADHEHRSSSQYPEWLEANKPSLSPEDYQRYEQQAKVMEEICGHFEKDDQEKESTFESIMDLMQKVDTLCCSRLIVNELLENESEPVCLLPCFFCLNIWLINQCCRDTVASSTPLQ